MSNVETWITIFLLLIATVLTRGSFFLFGHAVKLPSKLQHALRYAPAAALAAIVAPDLLMSGDTLAVSWTNPRLMAGLAAALFFLATRHLLATIVAGMTMFTVLRLM